MACQLEEFLSEEWYLDMPHLVFQAEYGIPAMAVSVAALSVWIFTIYKFKWSMAYHLG
jgi:hypothetical protein